MGDLRRRYVTRILCALIAPLALMSALSLTGCSSADSARVIVHDGRQYGVVSGTFRGRWWNYYERAVSYSEGGYYKEATDDLAAALAMRDADGRRARTYGMHFVDYFPHRELGIAYLGLGRPDDAVRELELSLSQEDSARAKFYLNKARTAILSASPAGASAPVINLSSNIVSPTNALRMAVSGTVSSNVYVKTISINGTPEFMELAVKDAAFGREVPLKEGENVVTVSATDLLGNSAERELRVTADRRGPGLDITSPAPGALISGMQVKVTGIASDPSGIARLTVNGEEMVAGADGSFSATVTLASPAVTVTATDGAGNTTTALLTNGEEDTAWLDVPGTYAHSALFAASRGGAAPSGSSGGPRIKLNDITDGQAVYNDSVFMDGKVSSPDGVASFTINGEELSTGRGKNLFFNYLAGLDEGANSLELVASDSKGRTTRKTVTINRTAQAARSLVSRLSVSAIPFEGEGMLSESAYDSFLGELAARERFNMVERELIEDVLQEQSLAAEGIVDPSTAARVGKIVSAECVLFGKFHETKDSVEVYARLVDTETAEVIAAHDVYGEDKGMRGIDALMEGLAVKFRNSLPVAEGTVIKMDGDRMFIDLGKEQGIRKDVFLVVFKEGEHIIHPVTGKDMGAPTVVLGKAKISEVYNDMAAAEIIRVEDGGRVEPLDRVITK
ncbi:MAG: hypothetical protein HZA22_10920 [Nitrospirae bacterium]|nr:hypothetical protein [Nitrospirota bacterium]